MVDLNVYFGQDGASIVTKSALSGGVTCIGTTDDIQGEIYTDVVPLKVVSDENINEIPQMIDSGVYGVRVFLVPLGPKSKVLTQVDQAFEALGRSVPALIHPEYATPKELMQATPYRCIEPDQRINAPSAFQIDEISESEESSSEDEYPNLKPFSYSPNGSPTTNDPGAIRRTSFKLPIYVHPFDLSFSSKSPEKKRGSLPNVLSILGVKKIDVEDKSPIAKPRKTRHSILCTIGNKVKPIPPQDYPFMKRGSVSSDSYMQHVNSFPEDWETAAIERILSSKSDIKIHFSNVCSNKAVELINYHKKSFTGITCETSLPYLYFNNQDVKPGDTRYKLDPPLRDEKNKNLLLDSLKLRLIDCISSYHQPVAPPEKFLGDFQRAVNGISSMGFALQGLWTTLKTSISEEMENAFLVLLATWLSHAPAKILNISKKGSIAPGKHADLVVWDPFTKQTIEKTFNKFSEMSPMLGEQLYGIVHRTYLRGQLVYSPGNDNFHSTGSVLNRQDDC